MACFHCLAAAVTVLLVLYWFQRDLSSLIYSSLPEGYKTWPWFTVCFLQEANHLMYCVFSASFIFQLHLLLPGTLSRVLTGLKESAKCCGGRHVEVKNVLKQVRVVQLMVNLFNDGHRNVTYCIKLICITAPVVCGYGSIAQGGEDFVFFLMASSITCDLAFLYAFLYQKAFAIPDGLQRVRRELTTAIQSITNAMLKK